MTLSRLITLSISSLHNFDIKANKFYDEAHRLCDASLLPDVTLNMLFGHISTPKLIILDNLSIFKLSTRGLHSLTYPLYLDIV